MIPLERETYIAAAELRQRCHSKGVQLGAIGCLIATACVLHGYPLLTADRDFMRIANYSDLVVLHPTE